jgi:hypothetical protein
MRKALVVGIDAYATSPLRGCVADANAMAALLATHATGSPNFDVKLLTVPPDTVGKAELRGAVQKLFEGDPDVALFYFSGHGHIKSTGGYVVTPDGKEYDEGVSMNDVLAIANQSRAKDKVILLDCCYSGALGTPTLTGGNTALLGEGLSVLTASRDSEVALMAHGKSVFTALVIDALQGGAADLQGYITAGSVYAYVDKALGPWDQRPIFRTNVTRFTSLRSVAPPVLLETLRKICTYFPSPQDEYSLDPSHEFTEKHHDPLKVAIFQDLQKFAGVGLVVPVGEEHMYYAAMNSKSCRLTASGLQYWRLVKEKKI